MSRLESVLRAAAAAGDTFRRSLASSAADHRDPVYERRLDERRAELAASEDCDLAARALAAGVMVEPQRALLVERVAAAELALEGAR